MRYTPLYLKKKSQDGKGDLILYLIYLSVKIYAICKYAFSLLLLILQCMVLQTSSQESNKIPAITHA